MYERLIEKNPEIEAVVMDAGYKTPWISKRVLDDKRIPVLPYKRPMGKQDFFKPYEYVYDKYYDCVTCPPLSPPHIRLTRHYKSIMLKSDVMYTRNKVIFCRKQ